MPSMREIVADAVARAKAAGVNPYRAVGIMSREGLNPNTINSPYFGNPDAGGTSYGPWQLYSKSKDPAQIAGGGMAAEFLRRYGEAPSAKNWQNQNQFAIDLMRQKGDNIGNIWHAVGDNGGLGSIENIGKREMARYMAGPEQNQGDFLAYAGAQGQPQSAGTNAINNAFGGGQGLQDSTLNPADKGGGILTDFFGVSPETSQTIGSLGDPLIGAGASIMAINNPSGAAALSAMVKNNKSKGGWQPFGQTGNGAGLIMRNTDTGETKIVDIPSQYQKNDPDENKTPAQKDFEYWQAMQPGEAKDAFGSQKGFVDNTKSTMTPEGLDFATEMYVQSGGKMGMTGLPQSEKVAVTNNLAKWAKDHDMTPQAVVANGPKMAGFMQQEREMGRAYTKMQTAKSEMDATLKTLEDTQAKVPKDLINGSVPWNAFMQKSAELWNKEGRPELAAYRETIQNASNAYATLLARGATNVPVSMQKRAEELFNSNMSPDTIKALKSTMQNTATRMMESMKMTQDNLRAEIAGKAKPHPNVEQEIEEIIQGKQQAAQGGAQAAPAAPAQAAPHQWTREELMAEKRRRERAAGHLSGTMDKAQ